ncbi:GNAT family N-acetyltransferase [Phyllobacterium myrsinacearum]|uniref:RimJ/RimL family protein N-acetyltransferase n=1 Tax=Phyllobacterium myrsinacearum TaxID=28101 RepID=A0A839E9F5_9HYPH|nr:GNAT family protein [Phyllobacterium myrsinacearum]MBA8876463.1 RimJ/RimL family protein N-acetyltransferase [Phyllobacterium myrsinacearum]
MSQSSAVTIAPVRPENIISFHEALDTVSRERKYLTFLEAPPLDGFRDFVTAMIADGNSQFVALAGQRVVGWCDIRRHMRAAHAHRGTLGMGIIPSYRGQGLGLKLINTTMEHARKARLVRIELDVHADNERAIALYEKVGFVREGVARDAVCIDGRYVDTVNMAVVYR